MDYRCPLCLKLLDQHDSFQRFCAIHPEAAAAEFAFSGDHFLDACHCQRDRCGANSLIPGGVFLRHINCGVTNPFWNGQQIEIAGDVDSHGDSLDHDGQRILHWQIGLLRKLPREHREMWFPLVLMAAGAKEPTGEAPVKPGGVMVGLAGAKRAGKTVLALQALDHEGYVSLESNDSVMLEDFIYCQSPPGGGRPILDTLLLRSVMKRNQRDVTLPEPTSPQVGDLKAVFIRQANKNDASKGQTIEAVSQTGFWKQLKGAALNAWNETPMGASVVHSWYSIAFYDTAGEDNEVSAGRIHQIDEAVDKVAVAFDADHLAAKDDESHRAIATVIARIEGLLARSIPQCLVITKVDCILYELGLDIKLQGNETVDESLIRMPQDGKRSLLVELLEKDPNENKRKLAKLVQAKKLPIFFVWHDQLPIPDLEGNITYVGQPVSHGLREFICWCLGVEWEDVSQGNR